MRLPSWLLLFTFSLKGDDSVNNDSHGGISFSISKTTRKDPVEHVDEPVEELQEVSTKTKTLNHDPGSASPSDSEIVQKEEGSGDVSATRTNTSESVEGASTRSLAIAHQTSIFFENLQNVSLTISQLGLEGINAAINVRTLSSYVELLIKCLDHLESLQSEEKIHYWALKDTMTDLSEYVTVDALEKAGRVDQPQARNKTVVETLELTEETKMDEPRSRSLLEIHLSPIKNAKAKIQDKVEKKIEKKIMEHITGGGDSRPKDRSLIEVGLKSPFNIREKVRNKFGKKSKTGEPEGRAMMEVGLGAVVREESEKSTQTRIVRRNPRPAQQVHKTTNINIDIKGIFKKARQSSDDGGHSHHHETHYHQQQVVHHHTPTQTGCISCMQHHYGAYYGAYR